MKTVCASLLWLLVTLAGCGQEEEHAHDASDFADRAECEQHYEDEGHDADEVDELCAELT